MGTELGPGGVHTAESSDPEVVPENHKHNHTLAASAWVSPVELSPTQGPAGPIL